MEKSKLLSEKSIQNFTGSDYPSKDWCKNLEATQLFVDFSKAKQRRKLEQILLEYGLPKETVTTIMILCRKHKSNGLITRG